MANKGKDVLIMKEMQIQPQKFIPRPGRELQSLPRPGAGDGRGSRAALAGGTRGRPDARPGVPAPRQDRCPSRRAMGACGAAPRCAPSPASSARNAAVSGDGALSRWRRDHAAVRAGPVQHAWPRTQTRTRGARARARGAGGRAATDRLLTRRACQHRDPHCGPGGRGGQAPVV